MNVDKIKQLEKYIALVKSKLADKTPSKHLHRVAQYKAFLESELAKTSANLESLRSK